METLGVKILVIIISIILFGLVFLRAYLLNKYLKSYEKFLDIVIKKK